MVKKRMTMINERILDISNIFYSIETFLFSTLEFFDFRDDREFSPDICIMQNKTEVTFNSSQLS
jgi:hypothetical protein